MNATRKIFGPARGISTILRLGFSAAPVRSTYALLLFSVGTALTLVSSYMIKFVVQAVVARHVPAAIEAAALLAMTAGGSRIAIRYYNSVNPKLTELISVHLDRELIMLSASIPTLEHHDRPLFANKLALIRSSRRQLSTSMRSIVLALRSAIMIVGVFGILLSIDLRFLALPVFALPRAYAGARSRKLSRESSDATAELSRLRSHLYGKAVSADAGKEIRVFGLGEEIIGRVNELTLQIQAIRNRSTWSGALWLSLGDIVLMAGCAGAIGLMVVRASLGEVGIGDVVLSVTMATTTVSLVTGVLQSGQTLQDTLLTVERFHWLEDFAAAGVQPADRRLKPPAHLERGISIENVSFRYPDRDLEALSGVSLSLPAGRVVALVGENGSGKSTLVKLLCGFYRPASGRIRIDDIDLADIEIENWRSRVSVAFQDFQNFELLMHESVAVGEAANLGQKDIVLDALARAGGADLAQIKPQGIDSLLGRTWGGIELSGGQWQKVALARTVFRRRPLLVAFDEPNAALDAVAEQETFDRFAREARSERASGRATLLISHRFSTVRMADTIVVLEKGQIAEYGSHQELMSNGKLYAELFELQARGYR